MPNKKILIGLPIAVGMMFVSICLFSAEAMSPQRLTIAVPDLPTYPSTPSISNKYNIFEGLVRFDDVLDLEPALAESWGNIDDNTWEFHIPRAFFSDGSPVLITDIIQSVEHYLETNPSLNISQNIISILPSPDSSNKIIILTNHPDSNFLLELSLVPIFREKSDQFIGTGPYQLMYKNDTQITLIQNKYYQEKSPSYQEIDFIYSPIPTI